MRRRSSLAVLLGAILLASLTAPAPAARRRTRQPPLPTNENTPARLYPAGGIPLGQPAGEPRRERRIEENPEPVRWTVGAGDPRGTILMFHGLGSRPNNRLFADLVARLDEECRARGVCFRVESHWMRAVELDDDGNAQREGWGLGGDSLRRARRAVEQALGPVLVLGHSMGAQAAVEVAQALPDRVRGVIGLAPAVGSFGHEPVDRLRRAWRSLFHQNELAPIDHMAARLNERRDRLEETLAPYEARVERAREERRRARVEQAPAGNATGRRLRGGFFGAEGALDGVEDEGGAYDVGGAHAAETRPRLPFDGAELERYRDLKAELSDVKRAQDDLRAYERLGGRIPPVKPTLVFHGTEDEVIPYRRVRDLSAEHPEAVRFRTVQGGDHRLLKLREQPQRGELGFIGRRDRYNALIDDAATAAARIDMAREVIQFLGDVM
ncbi:MAG: alpha/beta hydrolase [Deltaproteobacteria bacterium]|nr:alpha/beta hydrolase [Deltaproteobacteria bacterium]